ncbi:MAG: NADH-quinone oxidoreductase subunit J [Verrucomicrobiae bacterium]|nr:NADH-quinone oxidoreductase subunit J [Verrucomicrobiae bacterium]
MTPFPGSNFIIPIAFVVFVAGTAFGAVIAVHSARIIRSVAGLALCCIGLAGLFYFLQSPFLALMEILIYIGAVCVTIIFAIMLAEPQEPPHDRKGVKKFLWGACAISASAAIFLAVSRLSAQGPWTVPAERLTDGSVKAIGISLLTTYSLAFELISLVLLVAILGALVIARSGRSKV